VEIWTADDINNQILVYENNGDDNWQLDTAKTFKTPHPANWITMGLDRKQAYLSSVDIVQVNQHKIVTQMKDEYGNIIKRENAGHDVRQ
jgi:hypothetical protein